MHLMTYAVKDICGARRFYCALIRQADEHFDRHLARLAQEGGSRCL